MSAPTLAPEDLADRYGISRAQVMKHCRNGLWPHIKVGRSVRFTDEQVAQIDKTQTVDVRPEITAHDSWGRKTRRAS